MFSKNIKSKTIDIVIQSILHRLIERTCTLASFGAKHFLNMGQDNSKYSRLEDDRSGRQRPGEKKEPSTWGKFPDSVSDKTRLLPKDDKGKGRYEKS